MRLRTSRPFLRDPRSSFRCPSACVAMRAEHRSSEPLVDIRAGVERSVSPSLPTIAADARSAPTRRVPSARRRDRDHRERRGRQGHLTRGRGVAWRRRWVGTFVEKESDASLGARDVDSLSGQARAAALGSPTLARMRRVNPAALSALPAESGTRAKCSMGNMRSAAPNPPMRRGRRRLQLRAHRLSPVPRSKAAPVDRRRPPAIARPPSGGRLRAVVRAAWGPGPGRSPDRCSYSSTRTRRRPRPGGSRGGGPAACSPRRRAPPGPP